MPNDAQERLKFAVGVFVSMPSFSPGFLDLDVVSYKEPIGRSLTSAGHFDTDESLACTLPPRKGKIPWAPHAAIVRY
ncbi:hypothetical protein SBA2_120021 [Acidobacteriia bacterium SbA2]|nr:hypothetical protein SBA2_120021 [Acidobacteriia bacterium SbA2]